jgi:hypothetical protein
MVKRYYCKRTNAVITKCIALRRKDDKCPEQFFKSLQEVTNLVPFVGNSEFKLHGVYYGYPRCCIQAFVLRLHRQGAIFQLRKRMSRYTGFVPCYRHAKLLHQLDTSMCICDLLENRIDTQPFECNQFLCTKKGYLHQKTKQSKLF